MCHFQTRLCSAVLSRCKEPTEAGCTTAFQKVMEMPCTSVAPTEVKDVILLSLSKQSPFVNSGCFLCQRIAEPRASILRKLLLTVSPNRSVYWSLFQGMLPSNLVYQAPQVVFAEDLARRC